VGGSAETETADRFVNIIDHLPSTSTQPSTPRYSYHISTKETTDCWKPTVAHPFHVPALHIDFHSQIIGLAASARSQRRETVAESRNRASLSPYFTFPQFPFWEGSVDAIIDPFPSSYTPRPSRARTIPHMRSSATRLGSPGCLPKPTGPSSRVACITTRKGDLTEHADGRLACFRAGRGRRG